MPVTYLAQTTEHLMMLDEDGVCLGVTPFRPATGASRSADGAATYLGAQYVAALDPGAPGLLAHEPTVGVPMLFAKVGASGKITVMRTGSLIRFEVRGGMDTEAGAGPAATRDDPHHRPTLRIATPPPEDEEDPTILYPASAAPPGSSIGSRPARPPRVA